MIVVKEDREEEEGCGDGYTYRSGGHRRWLLVGNGGGGGGGGAEGFVLADARR